METKQVRPQSSAFVVYLVIPVIVALIAVKIITGMFA
jgi:hypothetical protein